MLFVLNGRTYTRWTPTGFIDNCLALYSTPGRRQSKTLLTIDERGSKSPETVFSIAICRQSGDKWQSKTLFLTNFDLRSSIVLTFTLDSVTERIFWKKLILKQKKSADDNKSWSEMASHLVQGTLLRYCVYMHIYLFLSRKYLNYQCTCTHVPCSAVSHNTTLHHSRTLMNFTTMTFWQISMVFYMNRQMVIYINRH